MTDQRFHILPGPRVFSRPAPESLPQADSPRRSCCFSKSPKPHAFYPQEPGDRVAAGGHEAAGTGTPGALVKAGEASE